jgi:hypothetical protein
MPGRARFIDRLFVRWNQLQMMFWIAIFGLGFVAGVVGTIALSCYTSTVLEAREASRRDRMRRSLAN